MKNESIAKLYKAVTKGADECSEFIVTNKRQVEKAFAENPMKIYGLGYLSGGVILGLNGMIHDSALWIGSAALAASVDINKVWNGRGGTYTPEASDFSFTVNDVWREVKAISLDTASVVDPRNVLCAVDPTLNPSDYFWTGQVYPALKDQLGNKEGREDVVEQLRNMVASPHKYPLDAGWAPYFLAGSGYAGYGFFGDPNGVQIAEATLGTAVATGSLIGFGTKGTRMNLVGTTFSVATFTEIASGSGLPQGLVGGVSELVQHGDLGSSLEVAGQSVKEGFNGALLGSGFAYLYGNYMMKKVNCIYQSDHTIAEVDASSEIDIDDKQQPS